MGRDGSGVTWGCQAADSPLPAPVGGIGNGCGAAVGIGRWCGAAAGLVRAELPGGMWGRALDRGRTLRAASGAMGWGDMVPPHPVGKGTDPSSPCPISAFHTTERHHFAEHPHTCTTENRKPPGSFLADPGLLQRFTPAPWVPAVPLAPVPSRKPCSARSLPNNIPLALQNQALVHPALTHPALGGRRCRCRSRPGPYLLGVRGRSGLGAERGLGTLPGLGFSLLLGVAGV